MQLRMIIRNDARIRTPRALTGRLRCLRPLRYAAFSAAMATATVAYASPALVGNSSGTAISKAAVATTAVPGYWLVASDGGIFSFGGVPFYGSMGGKTLNQTVVGLASTPDGKGYWEDARDGGIFAFGDAPFYGSMGGKPLNQPVVGMASDRVTGGYWEVAADGGIFAYNAPFLGSMGCKALD